MIAYLDTQAYAHIYAKIGCTGTDLANLRKVIYGRELAIRLSLHTLEEILLGRKLSPQAFAAQIKLVASLGNSRALIKPCEQLLFDDIRAYAASGHADRPFLGAEMQNKVADGIAGLIETDGEELEEEFLEVLHQARQQKQQFSALLQHALPQLATAREPLPDAISFEQLFAAAAPLLQSLAARAGAGDGCRQRGLEGLLNIKSVRMTLGATLAATDALRGQPRPANPIEIHHAVSAAAVAETYVSAAPSGREFISRLPMNGFNVITLPEFLKNLSGIEPR